MFLIIYVIGDDIYDLFYNKKLYTKDNLINFLNNKKCILLSDTEYHSKIINASFNLNSIVCPLPYYINEEPAEYIKINKNKIGCYMPNDNKNLYQYDILLSVIKQTPEFEYHFYNERGYIRTDEEKNISNIVPHYEPIIDNSKFVKDLLCGIYLTKHNYDSYICVNYIMNGKFIITNCDIDYALETSLETTDIIDKINMVSKMKDFTNIDGKNYYTQKHSAKSFGDNIYNIIVNKLIECHN